MITKLSVKGFKTLKDFSVPLTRVSVLVGPNNCGKSNVLRALTFLSTIVREGFATAIENAGGTAEVFSRSSDQRLEISVEALFGSTTVHYRVGGPGFGVEELSSHGEVELGTQRTPTRTFVHIQGSPVAFSTEEPGGVLRSIVQLPLCPEPIRQFGQHLAQLVVADFSMDRLRAKSLPVPGVQLKPSGENLAATLDRLHGEQPAVRRRIEQEVSAVVPSITGIVTPTVDAEGNKVVGILEGDQVFKADAVSDGILLFLALSTVSQMSGGRAFVCLEEPDRGIHPRRIKEILEQINRVAATGSQFLLTTHSPVLLNEFRDYPESVLILDRTDEQGTRATQLSSLPDVQQQLRDVSLGELWYSGVLGGVPSK
ncbi:MAG: AAA family ATPase [Archangium sp.]|nr:AAA family ATPase [Archangium sp.]MDP3573591.1 AAA family ATPase [Archangium sp.]